MSEWNYAEIWEGIAQVQPDEPAIIQGDRTISWGQFDARARSVAAWLLSQNVTHQDKVALYLYNAPEYLESVFASFRIGLIPVGERRCRRGGFPWEFL